MDIPLRALIIEDSDRDVALEVRALEAAGYRVAYVVAETATEMQAALSRQAFDLILSDHGMPQFDAPGALAVLKQSGQDIPFIVVSGTIGEETAVALMKAGAHDYIMKDRLSRLAPAVKQALKDVENLRVRKRAEEKLRESEELFRKYLEYAPDGVCMNDLNGVLLYGNIKCEEISGYMRDELIGKHFMELNILSKKSLNKAIQLQQASIEGKSTGPDELELIAKDGRVIPVEINSSTTQGITIAFVRDITERKRADAKLEQTLDRLKKAVAATIQVMVSVIEVRDPYTAGHQLRSKNLACAIAKEMGLDQEKIDGLQMAGSIHDIGKLSIPSEILSKPGKMTKNEYALIKEHSRKGYEIVKDVESSWPLAQIIYQHHERMNGSGYPRNLQGDEILMEARIMAVADVVEAMASHRPYRSALGIDAALEEIEKNRGTLYDNDVTDVCLRLFREKGFQLG